MQSSGHATHGTRQNDCLKEPPRHVLSSAGIKCGTPCTHIIKRSIHFIIERITNDKLQNSPPRSGGGAPSREPSRQVISNSILSIRCVRTCQNSRQQETRALRPFSHAVNMHGKAKAEKSPTAKPMAQLRATCESSRRSPRSGGGEPPCTGTEEQASVSATAPPSHENMFISGNRDLPKD
jgi:hypothetical protein